MSEVFPVRLADKAFAGILGFIVGDALGVPHEFRTREEMRADPANGMTGFGSHNQPLGTWSDDTSMMLCVLENLHKGGTPKDLVRLFMRWYDEGYHTPHGEVFDIGLTTERSLERLKAGLVPERPAPGDHSGSNGSLMRSLPYAFHETYSVGFTRMIMENRTTHRIGICHYGCSFFLKMARALAEGASKEEALYAGGAFLRMGWRMSDDYDMDPWIVDSFQRLFGRKFGALEEPEIRSGGHVMETLEAAAWSFMNGNDYRSCVLKAVNLGGDTDTIAALTGALAGIHYGLGDIPVEWRGKVVGVERLERQVGQWLGLPDVNVNS
jgi:ADP-ribosyl-[dinitrogen reductase] hydrolase